MSDAAEIARSLSAAQRRVVLLFGDGRAFSLLEVEHIRLLQDDDLVVIPSLVEVGLLAPLAVGDKRAAIYQAAPLGAAVRSVLAKESPDAA